jgi:GAF domain-containing protein
MSQAVSKMPSTSMSPQAAFEQLASIGLADHSLETVMQKVAVLTRRTVPGAASVSVTFIERGAARTVAFDGQLAMDLDERQYERGYGPCLDCIAGGEPVVIDQMSVDPRWPGFAQDAVAAGAGSSLSIPVPVQREVDAALNIYGTTEHAFSGDDVALARTFAAHAGVALANMHLYEVQSDVAVQLQAAMRSRAAIEQAKGILMGGRRCTAEEAFDILVKLSQDSNRKLRDVAQALLDQTVAVEG